jgi:hypothetical protein
MPALSSIVRGADEECTDVLDAAGPHARTVSEDVVTPAGTWTVTCSRSRTGVVSVRIRKAR